MGMIIGLTGGIASGKSTVARLFAELGARIVDADRVARDVVRPGTPAIMDIEAAFGPSALRSDGSLDREVLARLVFTNPEALAQLNAIVHPHVFAEMDRQTRQIQRESPDALILQDIPLLFECGLQDRFDAVIVVWAPEERRIPRLAERSGMSPEDARARLRAQMPLEEKRWLADLVIDNSGPLEETRHQVAAAHAALVHGTWPVSGTQVP